MTLAKHVCTVELTFDKKTEKRLAPLTLTTLHFVHMSINLFERSYDFYRYDTVPYCSRDSRRRDCAYSHGYSLWAPVGVCTALCIDVA